MNLDPRLEQFLSAQPYPVLFVTVSGAHLYGFASPDSDYDLRGAHLLPWRSVVGLDVHDETVQATRMMDPLVPGGGAALEVDWVSHDVRKFFSLLLKKNGYVLEQLFSPWVVRTTPEHAELKELAGKHDGYGVVTRHHAHHYFGFSETQWNLFLKESPRRVKPLLYVYRVLLTGIHLMKTGRVEANLAILNEEFQLASVNELIAQKQAGPEQSVLTEPVTRFEAEYQRLRGELREAELASALPESPTAGTRAALNELLIRLRLASVERELRDPQTH